MKRKNIFRIFKIVAYSFLAMVIIFQLTIFIGNKTKTFGFVPIISNSMKPEMERGSLSLIKVKKTKDIKVGDILVFKLPGKESKTIAHRISEITRIDSKNYYKTKGDANTTSDPWKFYIKSKDSWVISHSADHLGFPAIWMNKIPNSKTILTFFATIIFLYGTYSIWFNNKEEKSKKKKAKKSFTPAKKPRFALSTIKIFSSVVILALAFNTIATNFTSAAYTANASTAASNPIYTSGVLNSPTSPSCSWTNSLTTLTFNWTNAGSGQQNNTELRRATTSGGALTSMANFANPAVTGTHAPSPVTTEWFYKLRATKTGVTNWSSADTTELRSDRCKYAIDAYAGTGGTGSTGDGGLATAARFSSPRGMGIDSSNNVYVADSANNKIRKITDSTGIISTVAGNGTVGFLGDGGLATAARLSSPSDVAVASNGDMYIADTGNSRVRKVTFATGIITTFAGTGTIGSLGDGGLATAAQLSTPTNVLLNGNNLYIYTTGTTANTRIRVINLSTNIITLVAGGGANISPNNTCGYTGSATTTALLSSVAQGGGMNIDSAGDIYISDSGRNCIRKLTVSTGNVARFAGTGTAGSTTVCTTGVAPTAINISNPREIDFDPSGNVYFTITQPFCVYKITGGLAQKVAGVGSSNNTGDNGPALAALMRPLWGLELDTNNNLLFVQSGSNFRIRKVFGPLP